MFWRMMLNDPAGGAQHPMLHPATDGRVEFECRCCSASSTAGEQGAMCASGQVPITEPLSPMAAKSL
jgi:hypothetical protein